MSAVIPVAKQSPRISDGTIAWYAGDAFMVDWEVHLTEDGDPLVFEPGDALIWNFFGEDKENAIYTFTFNYDDISDNKVTLFFTHEISARFPVGLYTYCVKFICHDGRIVTLNANNRVKVEPCH